MAEVNDIQIGGSHYKKDYQHWDFVCDTDLHYLLGCATKYVARWKDKNGIEDLKKSLHYIDKAEDRDIFPPASYITNPYVGKFCQQLGREESDIIITIMVGGYDSARRMIDELIRSNVCPD